MSFLLSLAKFIIKLYISLYVTYHAVMYFYPSAISKTVFMNTIKWPLSTLNDPQAYGLTNVHNFYLNTDENVRVGIWHFIPPKLNYNPQVDSQRGLNDHLNKYLKPVNSHPVFIYVHGNDRDRATPFRVELCNNLVESGYQVFAIDYRGFGDSTGTPTELGVVTDVLKLYELIKMYNQVVKVVLYGHSLGTGIVSHAAKILSKENVKLDGVVLEAPFLNASQASKDYHLSLAFNNNKFIQNKTDEALEKANIYFNNDKHILEINSKILIMHGEDDWIVPFKHGFQLNEISKKRSKSLPPVKFLKVGKELGLGHFLQSHKPIYEHIKELIKD